MNSLKKFMGIFLMATLPKLSNSQAIQTSITLNPAQSQSFGLEKTNGTLSPVSSFVTNGTESYYYNGGAGVNNDFLICYNSYKYDHTGIPNSDISNVTFSFNYNTHYDINHPTNNSYWSWSYMYITSPLNTCNSNWNSSTLTDCVNREQCITNGNVLAYINTGGQSSSAGLNWTQQINTSTTPNLNAILQNANDFTIAFMPDGTTTCYMDVYAPSVVITYNTYPIANNVISGDQIFSGSGNPTLITAATLTGGNRNNYTYQWQSSLNNVTWTNISGATAATYDPPAITQTTYYRRIVNSAPQPASISNVVTATIVLTPLTPTGLFASGQSSSSIYLSWNASSNTSSYDVYTCTGTFLANVTSPNYTHTGLNAFTTYSYKIFAKNPYGSSPATSCVNGTTQSSLPPIPSGLRASVLGSNAIHLEWNGMSNTISYDVVVLDNNGNVVFQKNVTDNSCIAFGLNQLSIYNCYVRGNNSSGSSNYKMEGPRQTGALINDPSLYFNVTGGTEQSTSMSLNWAIQPNTDKYSIYKCDGTFIGNSLTPSYTHTGLSPNTMYDYFVVAVNFSSIVYRSSGYCFSFPTRRSSPSGFIATPLNCGQVILSWQPYSGSTSYYIYDCLGNNIGNTTSTNYVASVTPGNSYGYRMMAVNTTWSNVKATEKTSCISYNPSTYSAFVTATASQLCPGFATSLLTLQNCNAATTSVQWQSSVCGSAFQNIPGATAYTYLVASAASTGTSFRAQLISGATTYYSDVKVVAQSNVCNPTNIPACGGGGGGHSRMTTIDGIAATQDEKTELRLYPNPAFEDVTIEFYNASETTINVVIYDALGKIVYNSTESDVSVNYKKTIDFSSLSKGIYFVKINQGDNQLLKRIVKE